MAWTDDRIELLKRLVDAGLSASQIAARLGGFCHCEDKGRSAVIGKISRMRAKGYIPELDQAVAKRRQIEGGKVGSRASHIARAHNRRMKPLDVKSVALKPDGFVPPAEETIIPVAERKTLLQLDKDDCRFPIGDPLHAFPEFYFCGRPSHPGSAYCAHHHARCYTAPKPRQRPAEIVPFPLRVYANASIRPVRESEDA